MTSSAMPPMGWYPDPVGRHQYRYWDGATWTPHVADDGESSVDPLSAAPGEDVRAEPVAVPDAIVDPAEDTVTSLPEARECLGPNNVFGPDEWRRYFPELPAFSDDQLAVISEIPWSKSVLSEPRTVAEGQMGTHFLFLGLEGVVIAGRQESMNLFRWMEICHPGIGQVATFNLSDSASSVRWPAGPTFSEPRKQLQDYRADWRAPRDAFTRGVTHYAVQTCELRWYFVAVSVLQPSIGVSNVANPAEYDIATAVEAVTANMLHYLLNGNYLRMASQIARTRDHFLSRYGDVCVWSDRSGLCVGAVAPGQYPGVVLSRTPHA